MITETITMPVTVSEVLLASTEDPSASMKDSLSKGRAYGAATKAVPALKKDGQGFLLELIADAALRVVDFDLFEMFLRGWQKHSRLTAAAHRSLSSGHPEEVVLMSHVISSSHKPEIDILLDERKIDSVHLKLEMELLVEALTGVVELGRLVSLQVGSADLSALLEVEGSEIARAKSVVAPFVMANLGEGLALTQRSFPGR